MTTEPASGDDWAAQLTEKVGEVVDVIRNQTVGRVQKVVSAVIFGVLAFSIVILVTMMLIVGIVRLLDNEVFDQRVWASYFLIGGIFVVVGTLVSTMRHNRS